MWFLPLRVLNSTLCLEHIEVYLLMHFKVDTSYQFSSILWIFALCDLWIYLLLERKSVNFTMQIVVIILMASEFIYLT